MKHVGFPFVETGISPPARTLPTRARGGGRVRAGGTAQQKDTPIAHNCGRARNWNASQMMTDDR